MIDEQKDTLRNFNGIENIQITTDSDGNEYSCKYYGNVPYKGDRFCIYDNSIFHYETGDIKHHINKNNIGVIEPIKDCLKNLMNLSLDWNIETISESDNENIHINLHNLEYYDDNVAYNTNIEYKLNKDDVYYEKIEKLDNNQKYISYIPTEQQSKFIDNVKDIVKLILDKLKYEEAEFNIWHGHDSFCYIRIVMKK